MRGDDSTMPFDDAIADPRPSANPIEMEAVRARAEAALFGRAAPPRLGRYHIIDRIAGGGMGVVYSAYDPDLDRKVALKVVHPKRTHDDRSQARLITEARALAKLDHPNVVKVHDVLTNDGSVVIVMELVVGDTLTAWFEQPRTWRDAVALYAQAAQGLVAAHGVNVVHRDFKPSNAIIGADGRVRVLDFGLARLADKTEAVATAANATPISNLTEPGDVLGTLAYASPEQLRGDSTTAASDQFSLCVSLHHAVEGVAPFAGTTLGERLANIEARLLLFGDAARNVPAWLRAAIARGLSPRAAERFPDMAALVAELARPRGIRRFRTPFLVAGTLAAGIGATLAVGGRATDDACDGGTTQLAAVWSSGSRARIRHALDAFATPYAREIKDRALVGLDRYASSWTATHRTACRDHRTGATSSALLDRRMTCLGERLADLHAATAVIEKADTSTLANVMDVVARMPPVGRCSDLERLSADVEPPEGEALRRQVALVREKISIAEALSRAGRSDAARSAAAEAVAAAMATPYKPVQTEAALAQSRTLIALNELDAAIPSLQLARRTALEQSMIPAAVESAARLLFVESMVEANVERVERDAAIFEPLSRVHGCGELARPLLLNNLGVAFLSAGDRSRALAYFQQAEQTVRAIPAPDLELTVIERNLAMLTSDDEARRQVTGRIIARLRSVLGETHPSTLEAMAIAAEYEVDPAQAYALARAATSSYRTLHPTLVGVSTLADTWRAFLASELDDVARARADYRIAIERMGQRGDADLAILRALATGELALLDQDASTAERAFEQVRAARAETNVWWEQLDLLRAEVGLGGVALLRNQPADAVPHLETAVKGFPAIITTSQAVLASRLLARGQHLLARAVRATNPGRADQLEQAALVFYRRGPQGYAWLIATLTR
jgi:tetratricopeptide (TPR) repeat protein